MEAVTTLSPSWESHCSATLSSSQVLERESVHGGAPPSCTHFSFLHQLEHLLLLLPPESARRDESTSDSDPK